MMKNRTSVSKFEEFLKNKYHKEIFDIFEKLLDGAPFILDYNELEKFDKDLADLLIEKPEEEYAGLCPINVLKANFCVDDMPEEKMDDILRSFREKGIIQEAQEGYLKYCY